MNSESQDAVAAIEQALVRLRRDQLRDLHRGRREEGRGFRGGPPWAEAADEVEAAGHPRSRGHGGPPRWMRGGAHERPLGGAARLRLLAALLSAEGRKDADGSSERTGVSEIALAIGVDQPRASRLVNEAADRGLVTRRADERDARRSVIELTDAGRAILETARATSRSAVTRALEGFTPEETASFAEMLGRFVAAWPR